MDTIWITPAEAAQALSISTETLRRWDAEGRIPGPERRTAGGHRRYCQRSVERLAQVQRGERSAASTNVVEVPAIEREGNVTTLRDADGSVGYLVSFPTPAPPEPSVWEHWADHALAREARLLQQLTSQRLHLSVLVPIGTGCLMAGPRVGVQVWRCEYMAVWGHLCSLPFQLDLELHLLGDMPQALMSLGDHTQWPAQAEQRLQQLGCSAILARTKLSTSTHPIEQALAARTLDRADIEAMQALPAPPRNVGAAHMRFECFKNGHNGTLPVSGEFDERGRPRQIWAPVPMPREQAVEMQRKRRMRLRAAA